MKMDNLQLHEVLDRWKKTLFTGTERDCAEWVLGQKMHTSGKHRKEYKFKKVSEQAVKDGINEEESK